jgi:RimJ/RimL family protein N-acetyltransferase
MQIKNLILKNEIVSLLPLELTHKKELLEASLEGNLSSLWYTTIPDENTIDSYINKAIKDRNSGLSYPFVIISNGSNNVVGTTRFLNIDAKNKRLEIGNTWYSKPAQRTNINTNCKLLLLTYAFEEFNAIAVEFRTHWHNHKSRTAIARLGAKQDGILRNHSIHESGEYRDTVVFSIINHEWPVVKKSLTYTIYSKE